MRLIDVDELIEYYETWEKEKVNVPITILLFNLRSQPTAYDIDKVAEQLEEYKNLECDDIDDDIDEEVEDAEELYDIGRSQGRLEAYLNAIEIVKGGA